MYQWRQRPDECLQVRSGGPAGNRSGLLLLGPSGYLLLGLVALCLARATQFLENVGFNVLLVRSLSPPRVTAGHGRGQPEDETHRKGCAASLAEQLHKFTPSRADAVVHEKHVPVRASH